MNTPYNADEFIQCFRQLAIIIDQTMNVAATKAWISEKDKQKTLGRLAESVETIASLRGDSIFYEVRPEGLSEFQSEMYKTEDALRSKLLNLGYKYPQR